MPVAATNRIRPEDVTPVPHAMPQYDTVRKRANLQRLIAAEEARLFSVDAVPAFIRFEPHAGCNLRCCWAQRNPRHPGLRPRGAAGVGLARRIVGEIGPELYQAVLCHWGEPTLNPHFPEIAGVFHDAGIATVVHSNMMLVDRRMAERIVASGLDEISGSIDGASQQTYAQYRRPGRFERAIGGLREIIAARRRAGSRRPVVAWQFLVFPHNEHEVETARRMSEEMGVDAFRCFGGGGRPWSPEAGLGQKVVPPRPDHLLCSDPWRSLAIDWDGAVHLCCRAFKAEHVMGDVRDAGIKSIFNNERFQLARRVTRDGHVPARRERAACTGCNRVTWYEPQIAALGHATTLD